LKFFDLNMKKDFFHFKLLNLNIIQYIHYIYYFILFYFLTLNVIIFQIVMSQSFKQIMK
jgi:hypothetical protein